ncbi:hypothetical protein RJ45_05660 [Photobacterium gaetbulicola]|uniref:Uncharacterized protein n=1 Tax=Photobacterium gaetbulicola TaxID=1295392 RepID=A0A0B9H6S8_9GAMM|nr:hypothetical protein [Photobacterium gaetbulicola]KHT64577.1 hypothetical protein RJ45_05660 [Photobacterium gaetbulicola]
MSKLKALIDQKNMAQKELVASTVRMPKEMYSFIEAFAEHLSMSKQETMVALMEEGIAVAEKALKIDRNEPMDDSVEQSRFHLLNTNKRHSIENHIAMLEEGIAAAFYDPWKFNIDRIKKDDIVFLYENGKGIVAYGKATGETLKRNCYDDVDECHYQKLNDFKVLEKSLPAGEIKKTLNRNVVFLRTMTGMPDGQKVLDKIEATA